MEKFGFERLDVYRGAIDLTKDIYDIFESLPYGLQKTLGDNLLRAAVSVASNIAEGSGRRHKKEKKHFFEISQGSAFECIPMLEILRAKKRITDKDFGSLYERCFIISKMLSGLISHFS